MLLVVVPVDLQSGQEQPDENRSQEQSEDPVNRQASEHTEGQEQHGNLRALPDEERLRQLDAFRAELTRIAGNETPLTPLFCNLAAEIRL